MEAEVVEESLANQLEEVSLKIHRILPNINSPNQLGGKKFSKNLTPLDADGNAVSMWGVSRRYFETSKKPKTAEIL